MCPEAFYAVYPYFLGALYDAKIEKDPFGAPCKVRCLVSEPPAVFKIDWKYKRFRRLINWVERVFRFFGFPKDAIDKEMRVVGMETSPSCKLNRESIFRISVPDKKEVCPAAFFSIFPFANIFLQGGSGTSMDPSDLLCPDPKTSVVYGVSGEVGQSTETCDKKRQICDHLPDLSKYKIEVFDNGACELRNWKHKEAFMSEVLPTGLCPFILNVAMPYVITLQNGGYFKWRKDIHNVEVQCPSIVGRVAFEISREPSDFSLIELRINKVGGYCPMNHHEGETFRLGNSSNLCLHLFVRVFPILLRLEHDNGLTAKNEAMITCPFASQNTRYLIKKVQPLLKG